MQDFAEAAAQGMTLIYGPPGAGKTSLAMRLAAKLARRVMWISASEGPALLQATARRLAVDPAIFDFLDFPRSFRENVASYIVEKAVHYDAVVVDSVNGLAESPAKLEELAQSVLYQISRDKPVILVAEEDTPKLHYIADHVIHVWYRINSIGHFIRYAQLVKSRTRPPGPRYIFDITEDGLGYIRPLARPVARDVMKDEALGVALPAGSAICLYSKNAGALAEYIEPLMEESLVLRITPWSALEGFIKKEKNAIYINSFNQLFKLIDKFAVEKPKFSYIIVTGFLGLDDEDVKDYMSIIYVLGSYADFILVAEVGSEEDFKKLESYCMAIISR